MPTQSETFTVVTAYHYRDTSFQQVWTGAAATRNEAAGQAEATLRQRVDNSEHRVELIHQAVFLGEQEPLEPSATPFDFINSSPGVDDEEKELFRSVVSGERTDRLAIMSAFYGRHPVHCIVSVYQTEEDFLIQPLYLRIDDEILQQLRSPDGDLVGKIADD